MAGLYSKKSSLRVKVNEIDKVMLNLYNCNKITESSYRYGGKINV